MKLAYAGSRTARSGVLYLPGTSQMYQDEYTPAPAHCPLADTDADSVAPGHYRLQANGVELDAVISGPVGGRPLLLIPGLGMQLVDWPEGLVTGLEEAGFQVIRYDPRDIGLSQDMGHLGRVHVPMAAFGRMIGIRPRAPYTLGDLADDAAALLGALGIRSAHVCGVSMGGMVAQHLVTRHVERVQSLTLMMTTSGSPWVPSSDPLLMRRLAVHPPSRRDFPALLEHFVRMNRLIQSPAWPESQDVLTARVRAGLERSYRPHAVQRQTMAVLADGDRTAALRRIRVPTQIIQGTADRLVPAAAGRELARRIPGARLDEVAGMGHDLPLPLWPLFIDRILSLADRS